MPGRQDQPACRSRPVRPRVTASVLGRVDDRARVAQTTEAGAPFGAQRHGDLYERRRIPLWCRCDSLALAESLPIDLSQPEWPQTAIPRRSCRRRARSHGRFSEVRRIRQIFNRYQQRAISQPTYTPSMPLAASAHAAWSPVGH